MLAAIRKPVAELKKRCLVFLNLARSWWTCSSSCSSDCGISAPAYCIPYSYCTSQKPNSYRQSWLVGWLDGWMVGRNPPFHISKAKPPEGLPLLHGGRNRRVGLLKVNHYQS